MKVLPLPLLRIFLTQVVLTLALSVTINDANAQRRGGGGNQGGHQGGSQNGQTTSPASTLHVNQYMQDKDKIVLSKDMDLKHADLLSIKAQATSHNSSLELILNQQKIQSISLSRYPETKVVALPELFIGDKLVLKVTGSIFLESISALEEQQNSNPNHLVALLHGQHTSSTTLKVRQLIAQQNGGGVLQGKNLKKVIFVGSSARGRAQATLLINGMPVGYSQTIPTTKTRLVFNLVGARNIIGQQVKTIEIELKGRSITMNRVAVKLNDQGQGGSVNQSVKVEVNRSFIGSSRIGLSQLIGNPRRININSPIKKLVLEVKGHGNIMVNGNRGRLGSIIVAGQFGNTSEQINIHGQSSIAQTMLRISGNVTIKSVKVVY